MKNCYYCFQSFDSFFQLHKFDSWNYNVFLFQFCHARNQISYFKNNFVSHFFKTLDEQFNFSIRWIETKKTTKIFFFFKNEIKICFFRNENNKLTTSSFSNWLSNIYSINKRLLNMFVTYFIAQHDCNNVRIASNDLI